MAGPKGISWEPADEVWGFLIYGVLSVGALSIALLLGLIVAAPSQIYREQKHKIALLQPPPLNLYFRAVSGAATKDNIQLVDITLTNRSQRAMNLIFIMAIKYVQDDGNEGRTRIQGIWYTLGGPQSYGDKNLTVGADSTVNGWLVFHLPEPKGFGLTEWTIQFPSSDCVLEIKDNVSYARIACEPMPGYPDGAIAV